MKFCDSVDVLFCDNHLLVALKPAGLLTQPDDSSDDNLEDRVKAWIKKEHQKPGNVFAHCIHRLDRPVSGLVLFARTSKALSRLNEQSRAMEIQRIYVAEVEGILPEKQGRLDHFLVHGDHKAIVSTSRDKNAKHARLEYEVIRYMPHSTLVRIALETGRYHQIRAQFSTVGHPVFGDKKYGSRSGDGKVLRLHCTLLCLMHPTTKEPLKFESVQPF